MDGTGERSDDRGATWQPDFTITYQRVDDDSATMP